MILRSAMMSMNPHNGHVLAWVGGPDFKYFKYDQVKQGKRQIGSTFKPFVYVTAIDNGFSPCQKIPNEPVTFEDQPDYHPQNAGGKSGGYMTILEGLARSVNLITINLTHQLGPKSIVETAHKMGISSYLPAVPSIGLGVADISLYEMVGAYSTFANKGIWIKPIYLTKIEDANGNIIYSNKPVVRQAISEQTAYVMLKMMEEATNRGTAIRLRRPQAPYNIPYPIASKTGTTNDQSDGWYIGITPDLVTGVWTGGEDRIIRFYSLALGGGTNSALPSWSIYMNKVYKDEDYKVSTEDFLAPDNLSIELDCEKYAQFTGTPESEENISNTPGNPNNLNEERDKNIYDNNYHDNINNIKDIYKGDNVDDGHDLNF
ncbi:MAG: transglycosylase domain-containing protein [Solitalea-like symbiont of Acarus siro]